MPTSTMCPIPGNESQRLQALRSCEILDTLPEPEFDALARIAAHAFGTPIAVVAMLDAERLWFKSRIGLDIPQLDRRVAFCAHTIMAPHQPMVVPDLRSDPRFASNPLVAEAPHLRFYAGAPIVDAEGLPLGTIAVIDAEPRFFSPAQREALADLSLLVAAALQSRRRAMELQRLAMTDHLTGLGNRAQFDRALAAELSHAARTGDPLTLLWMDLDDFKSVNDRFGHLAGDEVLREVARRLAAQVRGEDLVARLGGDEFAVVLRHGDRAAAEALAQRIADSLGEPIRLPGGQSVSVGISVGLAEQTGGPSAPPTLLSRADQALYQAKQRSPSQQQTA